MIFVNDSDFGIGYEGHAASSIVNKLFRNRALKETHNMESNIVTLEPERQNRLLKWWSEPEAATLLDCLDKARTKALLESSDLQSKAVADRHNPHYANAGTDKLNESAEFATAIKVLKSFFPDGPFIARIEL